MARTVLIVDDALINRQILKKILGADYLLLEAADGREAVTLLHKESRHISAVLLDLLMPVMDGYDVLEKMRENPILSQIPVIVTTGDSALESEKRALALGANDFVTKPFDGDVLKRRLDNLIKLRETSALVNALQRDKMTNLWNRETFFEKAAWEIKLKPPGYYVLSSVDIDNFKVINEQLGVDTGDRVLKSLANMMQQDCMNNGGLCGRIGGDHFAALYPYENLPYSAAQVRERNSAMIQDLDIAATMSTGRYRVMDRSLPVSVMFDRATMARRTVKGRYDKHIGVYDDSMSRGLVREQQIVSEMRAALENDQFEAWYQPQYNHSTGALIGAEALARWQHPVWGLVNPGEFVPIFERNGFVYEMDQAIWKQVCIRMRAWLDEGRTPLPVSVNISRYDLFQDGLVEQIDALVARYAIPPSLLRLEITESAFAKSTRRVVDVAQGLIARGFTVEIDDFGSGYSSLNTLKDVPAQILKLDMRFFEKSDNLERAGSILESVVRMAKWLGMSVIAEGVELLSQAEFLKSIGCDYIQGYLYAKPIPAAAYEALGAVAAKETELPMVETAESFRRGAFWNPASMDTLIFNSYVGAACIFEYRSGRIELLRVSDKYQRLFSETGISIRDAMKLDWAAHMDGENRKAVLQALEESIKTGEDAARELVLLNLPKCPERVYLHFRLRVIASAPPRYLVYAVYENVTPRREAERMREDVAREALRLSREECSIALKKCGQTVFRYDLRARRFSLLSLGDGEKWLGVLDGREPEAVGELFRLTPESEERCHLLAARIREGLAGEGVRLTGADGGGQTHGIELAYQALAERDGRPGTALLFIKTPTEPQETEVDQPNATSGGKDRPRAAEHSILPN